MRVHYLRFDIWVCLALSVLVAIGTGKLASHFLNKSYVEEVSKKCVDVGEVGGIADESVFRVERVDDLFTHDLFTVISPGIEYKNKGAGFYKNFYLQALTLPSGEIVAARINGESVVQDKETRESTLPIGRLVKEDLTKEQTFLDQIQYKEPLSRTDFYIDMVGEASVMAQEDYVDGPFILTQIFTVVILFPIMHKLGSSWGIFPCFFPQKEKNREEYIKKVLD